MALRNRFNRFPINFCYNFPKRCDLRKRFGFVISDSCKEAAGSLADATNPFPPIDDLLEGWVSIVPQFVHFSL